MQPVRLPHRCSAWNVVLPSSGVEVARRVGDVLPPLLFPVIGPTLKCNGREDLRAQCLIGVQALPGFVGLRTSLLFRVRGVEDGEALQQLAEIFRPSRAMGVFFMDKGWFFMNSVGLPDWSSGFARLVGWFCPTGCRFCPTGGFARPVVLPNWDRWFCPTGCGACQRPARWLGELGVEVRWRQPVLRLASVLAVRDDDTGSFEPRDCIDDSIPPETCPFADPRDRRPGKAFIAGAIGQGHEHAFRRRLHRQRSAEVGDDVAHS